MAAYKSCEIISKRLEEFSSSSSESEDSDYDAIISSSASQYSSSCTTKSKSTPATVQRLPTRRPDPNVSNRNALLARENRRKKKEYLETLEKQLDSMKHVNKKLNKTLKKHMKLVKKLEHEKQYYKDLVSNQTGIRDLVSVLHGKIAPTPPRSSSSACYSPKQSSCSPTDSNRSSSSNFDDNQFLYDLQTTENDDNDSDYSAMYDAGGCTNWDTFLGFSDGCQQLPDEAELFKMSSPTSGDTISDEHNYYQSPPDSGVCLHSVEGTVPLESCLNCGKFASSNGQLPDELLVKLDATIIFRQKSISSSEEHCKTCVMNRSGGEHSINDNSFVIEMYRSKGDMFSSGEGFLFLVTKTKPSPQITTRSKSLQRKDMEKLKASLKPNQ